MSNPLSFEQFAACLAAVGTSVVISACGGNGAPPENAVKANEVTAPAPVAPAASATCGGHAGCHGDAGHAEAGCKGHGGCKAQGSCKAGSCGAKGGDAGAANVSPTTPEAAVHAADAPVAATPAPATPSAPKPKAPSGTGKAKPKSAGASCGQGTCSSETMKKLIEL